MRSSLVVAATVALATVVLAPAQARTDASRILDRTYSCEAGYIGGLYQVQLSTQYQPGSSSKPQVFASVTKNMWESPYGQLGSTGLSVNRKLCVPARGDVKLTTRGMRGGRVPPVGADAMCETTQRVLMRVRGVFRRPPQVSTSRQFGFPQLTAFGNVEQAAIALATAAGKSLAYVSVTGTEKARFFTVRTCKED